jgi:hypothetical protein
MKLTMAWARAFGRCQSLFFRYPLALFSLRKNASDGCRFSLSSVNESGMVALMQVYLYNIKLKLTGSNMLACSL